MRKIAVLIDGSNVHATLKALDFGIDWKKILDDIPMDELHSAYYFTAMKSLSDFNSLKPLIDFLSHNGYRMVTKDVDVHYNDGIIKLKGNMDVEIACVAMELGRHVTDVFLFTGDGDFVYLVQQLQKMGVTVTVISTCKTQPSMCSGKLRRVADKFIDLADIRDLVGRDGVRRRFLEGK